MVRNAEDAVPLLANHSAEIEIDEDAAPIAVRGRRPSFESPGDSSLLQRLSGKWQFKFESHLGKGPDVLEVKKFQSPAKQEYYQRLEATMEAYKEVDSLDLSDPVELDHFKEPREGLAVNASNSANILLLLLKVYASIKSQSIAIVASTLDSLLDLLAGAILWFTRFSMRSFDIYKYPIGKARVQPIGIIIFAAIMATLGLQVLIEAVRRLIGKELAPKMSMSQLVWLCSIMGAAIIIKLALYLYCRSFKNEIVQAYSKDHYFDVITNVVGLAAALLAEKLFWWIDPTGAILLAVYTITNWSNTVLENAVSLIGKGAPPEMMQKLTYLVFKHHDQIKRIDTVRAYTFGSYYFVEVDIELPEEMPLKEAHDIGETLQNKIESLPEVERAFVHLDYECTHKPEHSSQLKISPN